MPHSLRMAIFCLFLVISLTCACESDEITQGGDEDSFDQESAPLCVEQDFESVEDTGCLSTLRLKEKGTAEASSWPLCISEQDRNVLLRLQRLISGVWSDNQNQTFRLSRSLDGTVSCPSTEDPEFVQNCMAGWSIGITTDLDQEDHDGWFACESNHCPDQVDPPELGEGSSYSAVFHTASGVTNNLSLVLENGTPVLAEQNRDESWTVVYRKVQSDVPDGDTVDGDMQ